MSDPNYFEDGTKGQHNPYSPPPVVAPPQIQQHASAVPDFTVDPSDTAGFGRATAPPSRRLFSPTSMVVVAFFLGPAGPILMMALNYWRLERKGAAATTLAVGLLCLIGLMPILFAVPDNVPQLAIGLPLLLVVYTAANALQGGLYRAHQAQGGKPASRWSAAGVGLLGLMLFLGVLVGAALAYEAFYPENFGPKVEFAGDNGVYYVNGATEQEARALGEYLEETGFFNAENPKDVRIGHSADGIVLSFVVHRHAINDAGSEEAFRIIGTEASAEVFNGQRVIVELCGDSFEVMKRL